MNQFGPFVPRSLIEFPARFADLFNPPRIPNLFLEAQALVRSGRPGEDARFKLALREIDLVLATKRLSPPGTPVSVMIQLAETDPGGQIPDSARRLKARIETAVTERGGTCALGSNRFTSSVLGQPRDQHLLKVTFK